MGRRSNCIPLAIVYEWQKKEKKDKGLQRWMRWIYCKIVIIREVYFSLEEAFVSFATARS